MQDLQNLKPLLISIKGKTGWKLLPEFLSQRSEEEAAGPWEGRREARSLRGAGEQKDRTPDVSHGGLGTEQRRELLCTLL